MKKALASVVIIAFAGLMSTSFVAIVTGSNNQFVTQQKFHVPYFTAY